MMDHPAVCPIWHEIQYKLRDFTHSAGIRSQSSGLDAKCVAPRLCLSGIVVPDIEYSARMIGKLDRSLVIGCLDIEHLKAYVFALETRIFLVFPGVGECDPLRCDALLGVAKNRNSDFSGLTLVILSCCPVAHPASASVRSTGGRAMVFSWNIVIYVLL
jgi:hypothetical protein